jgi:HAE1 family hydrophobic/amphiphilic exporter-1
VRGAGPGQPVQVRIFGDDLQQLDQLAHQAEARLAARPELTYVINKTTSSPELAIAPDPERLGDLGLTTQAVGSAVRIAYQGLQVGRWTEPSGRERDVRVRLPETLRHDPEAVEALPLVRRGEQMLTLRQVATTTTESTPNTINRVNRRRIALLGAEPNGVPLGAATQAASEAMNGLALPAGTRWAFTGQGEDQADSFAQIGTGLLLSVVLMYMVLTILYENAIFPLLIQTALPLATVGAFLGLLVFGQNVSLPALIGMVALFGLVGKNSILLVDRANVLRKQGLERTAALEQAGPSRLRPILMTSFVLIFSMLPVALKLGDGGEIRAPLGAVLVGGMITSSFLSLLYVPVAYTYFDSFQTLLGRLVRWRPRLPARARVYPPPAPLAAPQPAPLDIADLHDDLPRDQRQAA